MSVFIVYSPQNIEGGGSDTIIRGVYPTLDLAKKAAQDYADLSTFKDWLDLEVKYKLIYDKGYRQISYLRTTEITEVPIGIEVNQELNSIDSAKPTYNHPFIHNHPKFDEYKKNFDNYVNNL